MAQTGGPPLTSPREAPEGGRQPSDAKSGWWRASGRQGKRTPQPVPNSGDRLDLGPRRRGEFECLQQLKRVAATHSGVAAHIWNLAVLPSLAGLRNFGRDNPAFP